MMRLSYWLQSKCSITGLKINDRFNYYFIVTHHRFNVFSLSDCSSLGAKKYLLGTLLGISWRISVIYLLLMRTQ